MGSFCLCKSDGCDNLVEAKQDNNLRVGRGRKVKFGFARDDIDGATHKKERCKSANRDIV